MAEFDRTRRLAAEALGTGLLLATVVGSGIMGETLAGGNAALALLANAIATGCILVVLILIFGPISGAHFNPAVTLCFLIRREIDAGEAIAFVVVQLIGGILGVLVAHLMFELPAFVPSTTVRSGAAQYLAEAMATFGLISTILGCLRFRAAATPYAVGLVITAGYWYTASTSFANPAVTISRTLTDTFSGIRPVDAPAFILTQVIAAAVTTLLWRWFLSGTSDRT